MAWPLACFSSCLVRYESTSGASVRYLLMHLLCNEHQSECAGATHQHTWVHQHLPSRWLAAATCGAYHQLHLALASAPGVMW